MTVRWLYSLRRPARGDVERVGEEKDGCIIKRDKVYLKLIKDGIHIHEVEKDSLQKYSPVCKHQSCEHTYERLNGYHVDCTNG